LLSGPLKEAEEFLKPVQGRRVNLPEELSAPCRQLVGRQRERAQRSHVDNGDALLLRALRFLDEPGQVIWITGQQDNRALCLKRRRGHNRIDCTPMPRKTRLPEKFSGSAGGLGTNRHDRDPRYHPVHGGIACTAPEYFR
jgi:hypothetical protein